MAAGKRGLIALTVVIAMLSIARPTALAMAQPGHGPAAVAMDLAACDAVRDGSRTAEEPTREQPVPRFVGAITPIFEEDDSDRFGMGPHLAVPVSSAFEPPPRLQIAELADVLRLVIARGWRALPRGRGPPAA